MTAARDNLIKLEAAMSEMAGYDHEGKELCEIKHWFAPGVYAREMFMPEGCLVIGKIHKTEHLNILSTGKMTISDGEKSMTVEAPFTYVSPIGTKRALYAHKDAVWTTIHATELTEPEAIEAEIIAESFDEIDALLEQNRMKELEE